MISIWSAFVLDFFLGDPQWFPHPVRFIGRLVKALEKTIRLACKNEKQLLIGGGVLAAVCVSVVFFMTYIILEIAKTIHPWLFFGLNIVLMYFSIAANCLKFEGKRIEGYLLDGDMENSRKYLAYIVGRDVDGLGEPDIVRGTVETVAENTSDGVIAPLLYMLIGGAPLAMAYKAINTMDSMIGYKNEKYLYFGRAAARLDDAANYIPARLTGLLIVAASFFLRYDWKGSLRIMRRDGRNHTSPNSGFPEAAAAGAIGVRLGGVNRYFGVPSEKPYIGDPEKELEARDITKVVRLMYGSSLILLLLATLVATVV